MPLYLISDSTLDELCLYLTQQTYIYYPVHNSYLNDLYNTGCRPMELLQVDRWAFISPSVVQLIPEKGNSERIFDVNELTNDLLFAIDNQIEPYQSLSLRQLTSVTKKILPVPQVQTIAKSAVDYLFRYNFVKRLHDQGKTDAEITAIMGWVSPLLAASYYTTQMFSTEILPPLPSGNLLLDNSGNFLIDYDGTFINWPDETSHRIKDSSGNIIQATAGLYITTNN